MGAILVIGMLIIPASTAYLLTERLSVMIMISLIVGVSSVFGYYTAVVLDVSIAGCMVAVSGLIFGRVFVLTYPWNRV
ncbi:metal ABC transporter permease [Bacillus sp. E214]|uniref:metal ABC transporter permease n=1 Tax=Bacillus sp. E214 TaxID=2587156 RepID=UPI0021CC6B71|nr:metal ABC transporter permease [Bacillus sp. E214]